MAAINPTITSAFSASATTGRTYRDPFAIGAAVFFMWGFMTVFNDILIPRFKKAFALDYFHALSQGKLVDILIKGGNEQGLSYSLIVPLIACAYVAFYG